MTVTPVGFNDYRFKLLNETAFFLGEKKREIRLTEPVGDELEAVIAEICNAINKSGENDLIEEYEVCIASFNETTSDEAKRAKLHVMLDECRRILRNFKLEYGFAPGKINKVHAYGLFSMRNDSIYYIGRYIDITGQPERLFRMFLEAPNHWLSQDEIMNLDGEGSGGPRKRVSILRAILRKYSKKNLLKSANYGAQRGYKLITV